MGTSLDGAEGKQEGDGEELIIPWDCVDYEVQNKLIVALNPEADISGNDWKGLAAKLGYTLSQITFIQSQKENNATYLFKEYSKGDNASFNEIYKCLELIRRKDCLKILKDALPDVKRAYEQGQGKSKRLQGSSFINGANGGTAMSCYLGMPSSFPCRFQSCGHNVSCHHNSSCSYPARCHSCSHSMPQENSCIPGFPQPHCHYPSPVVNSLPTGMAETSFVPWDQHPHMPSCGCYSQETSRSGYAAVNKSPKSACNMPNNVNNLNMNVPSMAHGAEETRVKMSRQISDDSNLQSGHLHADKRFCHNDGRYQTQTVISKSHGSGGQVLRMGEDSPKFIPHLMMAPSNHAMPNLPASHRPYTLANVALDAPLDLHMSKPSSGSFNGYQDSRQTGAAVEEVDSKQGLMHLKELCGQHSGHQRRGEYARAVNTTKAEQPPPVEVSKKEKEDDSQQVSNLGLHKLRLDNPHTYPKIKATKDTEARHLSDLNFTKKSASMPKDMQPSYKTACRSKIFVSHSSSTRHQQLDVLKLCQWLEDNGFACSVDVTEDKDDKTGNSKLPWCRSKFQEADFIIACITDKYLGDVSSHSPPANGPKQLHSFYVYQMMQHEGKELGRPSSRVVPLLFDGLTQGCLPVWLQQATIYGWPKDFENLWWLLTRPQARLHNHCRKKQAESC